MIKRLPVLYQTKENLYTEVEVKKPSGKVISDTNEAKIKNPYTAMRAFVSGCIVRIISEDKEITEEVSIKRACDLMSTKNLEYLSQELMVLYYNGEDFIEGVYECPRCHETVIAQKEIDDGMEIDTRDRISDLKVVFMEDPSLLTLEIALTTPVSIKTETFVEEINSLTIGFPTTEDTIKAYASVGDKNEVRLQYAIYANALQKINGEEVDTSWKRNFGLKLFNGIEEVKEDIGKISDHINSFGVDPRLEKTCKECGKVWHPLINTPNFFDSALQ